MVCFVHDRRFLSQFHAIVNKLRKTNQFTTNTLRQLPNRCCSCREKQQTLVDTELQPLLTTLDFDALQRICIILDLKQCLKTNVSSLPSPSINYAFLPFRTLYPSNKRIMMAERFINEYQDQLPCEEETPNVDVQFVTSSTPQQLLNAVIQYQCDLVTKSSSSSEAKQAVNSLWVILSAEDQAQIDMIEMILQKRWARFLENIEEFPKRTVRREDASHQLVTMNAWCKLRKSGNGRQEPLSKQQTKLETNLKVSRPLVPISQKIRPTTRYLDDYDEYLIEDALMSSQARLQFLSHRFENSSKPKQPRTHRRQHLLALVLVS